MKLRQYNRDRLISSLWYCGFYAGSLFYTTGTLIRNNIDPFDNFNVYKLLTKTETIETQFIFGYLVLLTFYIHSFIWEIWHHGLKISALDCGLVTCFLVSAWVTKYIPFINCYNLAVNSPQGVFSISPNSPVFARLPSKFYQTAPINTKIGL